MSFSCLWAFRPPLTRQRSGCAADAILRVVTKGFTYVHDTLSEHRAGRRAFARRRHAGRKHTRDASRCSRLHSFLISGVKKIALMKAETFAQNGVRQGCKRARGSCAGASAAANLPQTHLYLKDLSVSSKKCT
ncbi:hypothetical protein EVAR_77094_1 [Eumeta japonica]|uniref:Uncharacterized protein n=1 Tax=Eumeta variegata TaxID=151549 RepID=A0A4C1T1I3_EUMVA|nr:hypothetical protein EVAR_77094_1 [Eumeta japonica]